MSGASPVTNELALPAAISSNTDAEPTTGSLRDRKTMTAQSCGSSARTRLFEAGTELFTWTLVLSLVMTTVSGPSLSVDASVICVSQLKTLASR